MAQVFCTLPNASALINGVRFAEHAAGRVSEEIADDLAAAFAAIPGYRLAVKTRGVRGAPSQLVPAGEPSAPAAEAADPSTQGDAAAAASE